MPAKLADRGAVVGQFEEKFSARRRQSGADSLDGVGGDAHGDADGAILVVLARHHFGVLVEPVQSLTVG